MRKNVISSVIIFVVGAILLTGVNFVTGPIIEKNDASAANGALLEVLPEATGFEKIYGSDVESTLTNVSEFVVDIYQEVNGLGYVLNLMTTEGYTHEPIQITLGINADGRIVGINEIDSESKLDWKPSFMEQFANQDSTLADVNLYAGCTYSTSAIKNAVAAAFDTLVANDLMKAGVKSATQIYLENLSILAPGMTNAANVGQYDEFASEATLSMIAKNNTVCAYVVDDQFVVINNCGIGAVYSVVDEQIVDITESNQDLIAKFAAVSANQFTSFTKKDVAKLDKINTSGSTVVELKTFNSVTTAVKFNDGQYGFVSRPYGYGNDCMVVYYILDAKGAIVYMDAYEFILIAEYFNDYSLNEEQYKQSFVGLTVDTLGEEYLISGATVSSDAIRTATKDVFAAFAAITGGKN